MGCSHDDTTTKSFRGNGEDAPREAAAPNQRILRNSKKKPTMHQSTRNAMLLAMLTAGCPTAPPSELHQTSPETGDDDQDEPGAEMNTGSSTDVGNTSGASESQGTTSSGRVTDTSGRESTGDDHEAPADTTGCTEVRHYLDFDGDGFGDPNDWIESCEPLGLYATTIAGDCCDIDVDAFPGQTAFFFEQTNCGGWDYDCNGAEEKSIYACECIEDDEFFMCSNPAPDPCITPVCGADNFSACTKSPCSDLVQTITSHVTQYCR